MYHFYEMNDGNYKALPSELNGLPVHGLKPVILTPDIEVEVIAEGSGIRWFH